jgi:hypothetical protein
MLERFLGEPLRNGHFTHFRTPGIIRENDLAACEVEQNPALSEGRQVVEARRTDGAPANTHVQDVATETGRAQDIAHIGAWAKEKLTWVEMEAFIWLLDDQPHDLDG